MKNNRKAYTSDMRDWMRKFENESNELFEKMHELPEMFPQVFGKRVAFEQRGINPNIDFNTIEVGDELYLYLAEGFGDYFKIKVTNKYLTVLFYKWLEGSNKGKEEYMDEGCYMFMKDLYPMIIKILPGWTVDCNCDKTIFVEEE